jgi:hypothetical protein
MCEPATITAGLAIASAVGGVYAQRQMANAQEDYNQKQYANTMQAFRDNIAQTNLMQDQEHAQAVQQKTINNMQAAKALSTAAVSAGESGVSGLSVDALLSDLAGQRDRYNESVDTNYQNASAAIDNQRRNISTQAASQINSLRTPQMPDYLGAGLRIATAYDNYKNPRPSGR